MKAIAVYCGSQVPKTAEFQRQAKELGQYMASKGIALVFGGYNQGMMGLVAEGVQQAGGRVIGVTIEHFTKERQNVKEQWETHVTANLSDRRRLMMELADAFVALPGGFGTLDELTEVLVEASLQMHHKPIGILNSADYYGAFLQWRQRSLSEGFEDKERADRVDRLLVVKDNPTDLLDGLLAKWEEVQGSS